MCDGRGDPCDAQCGGAGCGTCGGVGCSNGAVTKAGNALKFSKDTEVILKEKSAIADQQLDDVSINILLEENVDECHTENVFVKYLTF